MLNADAIVGNTGELLGHNMYAYSKNNPVNMSDPSGFRPIFSATLAEETEEMRAASFAIMNGQPVSYVAPKKKRAIKKLSDTAKNVIVNTATGIGNVITGSVKSLKPYQFKTIPSVGFMFSKTPVKEVVKNLGNKAGYVGVAYGLYDAGEDLVQGKIMGALIDTASCGVSAAVGYGIGAVGGSFIAVAGLTAAPAAIVTGAVIGLGIGASVLISNGAEQVKNWWYRRKNI